MSIPRHSSEFHTFDFGTAIIAEVRNGRNQRVDVSGASAVRIFFMRPDGSGFSRGAFLGNREMFDPGISDLSIPIIPGADGTVYYVVGPGDIDTEGDWYLQFVFEFYGGTYHSSAVHFVVLPNIISSGEILSP